MRRKSRERLNEGVRLMEQYEELSFEVITFDCDDIIRTSREVCWEYDIPLPPICIQDN